MKKYFNKQKINTLPVSLKQLVNSLTFKDLQHQEEAWQKNVNYNISTLLSNNFFYCVLQRKKTSEHQTYNPQITQNLHFQLKQQHT